MLDALNCWPRTFTNHRDIAKTLVAPGREYRNPRRGSSRADPVDQGFTPDYLSAPAGNAVPYKPIRILIAYDNEGGRCGMVIPRLKELLEDRAFEVETLEIGAGDPDLEEFQGVLIGTPVTGLAIRNVGPTQKVADFINTVEGLDEKKVALFCVYDVRAGDVFDKMKNLVYERGAEYVAEWAYWRVRPEDGETMLPAECMIRIR